MASSPGRSALLHGHHHGHGLASSKAMGGAKKANESSRSPVVPYEPLDAITTASGAADRQLGIDVMHCDG